MKVKVNGAYKDASGQWVKVNGIWKQIASVSTKVNGIWKAEDTKLSLYNYGTSVSLDTIRGSKASSSTITFGADRITGRAPVHDAYIEIGVVTHNPVDLTKYKKITFVGQHTEILYGSYDMVHMGISNMYTTNVDTAWNNNWSGGIAKTPNGQGLGTFTLTLDITNVTGNNYIYLFNGYGTWDYFQCYLE